MNVRLHRIHLLTAFTLLLAGLVQPLMAAEGLMCTRLHGAGNAHASAVAAEQEARVSVDANEAPQHRHDLPSDSHRGEANAPAAPCPAAALPTSSALLALPESVSKLLPSAELPPAHVDLSSLFRPPRLG